MKGQVALPWGLWYLGHGDQTDRVLFLYLSFLVEMKNQVMFGRDNERYYSIDIKMRKSAFQSVRRLRFDIKTEKVQYHLEVKMGIFARELQKFP